MSEPGLFINLVSREKFGETWQFVTFTIEGEDEPFHEIPYFVYKHYDADFLQMLRAGLEKGLEIVGKPEGAASQHHSTKGWVPFKDYVRESTVGWVAYAEVVVEAEHFNEDGTYTPAKKRLKKVHEVRYDRED